jgi:hypothetical protein
MFKKYLHTLYIVLIAATSLAYGNEAWGLSDCEFRWCACMQEEQRPLNRCPAWAECQLPGHVTPEFCQNNVDNFRMDSQRTKEFQEWKAKRRF